ncbi:hypothetical protein FQR65_LT15773 [Abscondita terminalis]|nr:hypothetical protein FQR65_LT15773 [Abscondita terminalis]
MDNDIRPSHKIKGVTAIHIGIHQQQAHLITLSNIHCTAPIWLCKYGKDLADQVNLSPFSYFNLMSHQPPVCVFSPLRRMRDGTTKHTLENIKEVKEVVYHIVATTIWYSSNSLASTEYAKGINEFLKKSALQLCLSTYVKDLPGLPESPCTVECKVKESISALSDDPRKPAIIVLAEVVCMHIHEDLLDSDNQVDQAKLDLVARLGGDWYCRVTEESLFKVPKPLRNLGIGIDQLPESIRFSTVLTGNHLGMLANVEVLPEFSPTGSAITRPEELCLLWENGRR